jgi:hypothetical protein
VRHFLDEQMKGHALLFDGPLDLVKAAREANEGKLRPFQTNTRVYWPGRKGNTWAEMERFLHEPWPEAMKLISKVVAGIKGTDLPQPKDVRRRPRWSEDDGEVDVDRALHGDPDYMREVKRTMVTGPFHIALVSNLDLGSSHRCNPSGVFFRSACAIALADMLEDLGYTVEIWTWTRGLNVYPQPYPHQFLACCPKRAGDPVDFDALCDTMSAWFTVNASFGAFAACPTPPVSKGSAVEPNFETTDVAKTGIGKWLKYLDIQDDVVTVPIPMIYGSLWSDGISDGANNAVKAAHKVLETIVNYQR